MYLQLCRWKFTHETLQQTFFNRSWILLEKTTKSRFVPPFGRLRANVHGSSMVRWKARGRLPISANWTFFASCHGWGAMSKYWSKLWLLKGGWVILSAHFRGKDGCPQTTFGVRKLESMGITWCCLHDPTFCRFDTIPACDTQTDTRWWLIPRRASAAPVKI